MAVESKARWRLVGACGESGTGAVLRVPVVTCNRDGTVVEANESAQSWLMGATSLLHRFDDEERARVRSHLEHARSAPATSVTHLVAGALTGQVQLTSAPAEADRVQIVITDVSELVGLIEQLRAEVLTDPLTGLANRTLLQDHLQRALAAGDRDGPTVAVLFCDLDDFKSVNDNWGHPIGDEVLVTVAKRLVDTVRPTDIVARVGGDEFVILLDGVDERGAVEIAERLLTAVSVAIPIDPERQVCTTVSIGVAVESGDCSATEMWGRADTAMYAAKARGRAQTVVHDDELDEWLDDGAEAWSGDLLTAHLDLRRRFEQLVREARTDNRTGLPDDLQFEVDHDELHDRLDPYGLLFADIDWFHEYNHRYTHLAGHQTLARVGNAISAALGTPSRTYRYGGEEFVVLIGEVSTPDEILDAGERVRAAVESLRIEHASSPAGIVTVSVGCALGGGGLSTDTVVRMADEAMLTAKRLGRNRVHGPTRQA